MACPAWSRRICLTSRELSAKDGDVGLLETLAVIASSVQGVLVHLGDGGVLGVLFDLVEPLLLEELPLVSVEAVSVVTLVPVVYEEPGLLSDVPLLSAVLLSASEPVSGHIVMIPLSPLCWLRSWHVFANWNHHINGKCGRRRSLFWSSIKLPWWNVSCI